MPKPWSKVSVHGSCACAMFCGALILLVAPLQAAGQSPEPQEAQSENRGPQFYFIMSGPPGLEVEHKVNPVYPPVPLMARIQGTVSVDVKVETDGSVSVVKASSGQPQLIEAACDAVRQWKFAASPWLPAKLSISVEFRQANPGPRVHDHKYFPEQLYSVTSASANYPEEARNRGVEGQVALELTRGQSGEMLSHRILKSDNDLLNSAAVDLVQNRSPLGTNTSPALSPGKHRVVVDFELNHEFLSPDGPLPIAGGLVQAPADMLVTRWSLAMYPPDSQQNHVEGDVQVKLAVDENGEISGARVISGPASLQAAALEASKKWRFAPPSAAPADVTINYHFWVPD